MKKKLLIIILTLTALLLCITACADPKTDNEIEALKVDTTSITTEYEVGDTPDFSGIKVTATYKDGTQKQIAFSELTIETPDMSTDGKKTVKVKYENAETSFEITVNKKPVVLTAIDIIESSVKTSVFKGTTLDLSELQVEAVYSDGTKKGLSLSDVQTSEIDTSTAGEKTLTVTYEGKTDSTTVKVLEITGIAIDATTLPPKKIFVGESLDTSGIKVSATYEDGNSEKVSSYKLTFGNFDNTKVGKQNLTISYNGKSISYEIEVVGINSLVVTNQNLKVTVGQQLDMSNITAKLMYTDGESVTYTADQLTFSSIDTTTAGKKTLTVSYGQTSTTVDVTVVGVEDLRVLSGVDSEIFKGEPLNTNDIIVSVTYTDGSTRELHKNDLTLGSIDHNTPGNTSLSITYLDKTISFPVKVCKISSILPVLPADKLVVQAGNEIDITGLIVYGIYDNTGKKRVELPSEYITTNIDELNKNKDLEGDKKLTVVYDGEYGRFTDSSITISTTPPAYTGITIDRYTSVVCFGDTYSTADILPIAHYGNGNIKELTINDITVVGEVNTALAGSESSYTQTLKISYTEGGVKHETTLTVTVLRITKLTVSNIAEKVDLSQQLNTDAVSVVVTFGEGNNAVTRQVYKSNGVTVSAPDTTTGGDKMLTVSYLGSTTNFKYHVKAIARIYCEGDIVSEVMFGHAVDHSKLKLWITYTDGTIAGPKALTDAGVSVTPPNTKEHTINADMTVTAADICTLTVSYSDEYGNATWTHTIKILKVSYITGLNGTIPSTVMTGDTSLKEKHDEGKFEVDVYYDNGTFVTLTSKDPLVKFNLIDTSEHGEKAIVIYYMLLEEITHPVSQQKVSIYTQTTNVHVTVRGVSSIDIVDTSIVTMLNKGKEFTYSGIQVLVSYTDGSTRYLGISDGIEVDASKIDNGKAGEYDLTVTYKNSTDVIKIKVIDPSENSTGFIVGALLPDHIVARETYKKNFKVNDNPYLVGDDNPYIFYLNVLELDANDNIIENTDSSKKATDAEIYLDGNALDLSNNEYVEKNGNAYDFSEKAIGKTFTLKVRPAGSEIGYQTHTVKVVDGYNVHEAWELNVMTNYNNNLDDNDSTNNDNQIPLVREFLSQKMGRTFADDAEYLNFTNSINSLVIHNNLNVTTSDIPAGYICHYTKDNTAKTGLWEQMGVFDRRLSDGRSTFAIYGNYYSIYSYNLPPVVENGFGNNEDAFSSSSLIKILVDGAMFDKYPTGNLPFNNYSTNVQDLAMRDNDPNSNDQSASERHMRGISALKFGEHTANVTNVNVDAFMISMIIETDYTTVNLTNVKFYNAWQGHVFAWASNSYQDKDDEPFASHKGIELNVKNSLLAKCGGPVILAQSPNRNYTKNKLSSIDVTVDKASELYSYVTGQEAWFVAVGQTATAGQILAMNNLVQKSTNGAGSYTHNGKIQGVNTVNMIMVNMGEGQTFGAAGENYSGSYKVVDENGNTKTTGLAMTDPNLVKTNIENDVYDGIKDGYNYAASNNPMLYTYITATAAQNDGTPAPVFQTSAGGTAYTDGATNCFGIDLSTRESVTPAAEFSQGEFITLYYQGMGIMLEYYNPTNPD